MNFAEILFSLILLSSVQLFAQTGPGGIGTADGSGSTPVNVIWLEADALGLTNGNDILSWSDLSGNGNGFSISSTYSPVYRDATPLNGHAYAEFSKSNNRIVLNPFNGMPDDRITTIVVYKTSDSGDGLLSYNTNSQDNAFLLFNNSSLRTYINGSNHVSGASFNSGNWQILTHRWRSSDGDLRYFRNGSQVANTTFRSGTTIGSGGSIAIGGEQDAVDGGYDPAQAFSGDIAEVILYDAYLNDAQKAIIENHLSAKYGIAISNDLYAGDGIRDYDYGVVGIGQEANGSQLTNNTAGLVLSPYNGSLDTDGEYILAGHDNKTNAVATDSLGSGVQQRWFRSWYVDKTTSGTLDGTIAFDFSDGIGGGYPANNTDYELLMLDLGGTNNYEVVTVAAKRVAGDRISFDVLNANLTDGFYTLGTTDAANAPVDGVSNTSWYSYKTGNWNDPLTWTTDASGNTRAPSGGGIPSNIDNVEVLSGDAVTADADNIAAGALTVTGELIVNNTSGHSFQSISGNGRIKISGAADGTDNFPDGDATGFADSINGGELVIEGTGIELDQSREFNNVTLNLDAASNTAVMTSDWKINGTFDLNQGILQINDATNNQDLSITVMGDVTVQSNAEISVGTGDSRHQFDFYGNFTNSGTVAFTNRGTADYNNEATDGIVDANFLADDKNQTIDCLGPTAFYRIEIDKGDDDTYILDIKASGSSNFNLYGYAHQGHSATAQLTSNSNALGLLKGTVRINENVNIPVLNNTGNYNIPEAARLWVNGGSATKPTGTAIVPYGTIQVSAGSLSAPVSSGITTRDNGNIVVEGGTLTTNQIRTSVLGADNIGGYTQSGGTVNVTGGSINNDYYTFSLTYSGNTFTMSGGTLNVSGSVALKDNTGTSGFIHGGAVFINSADGNYNVTGGTVTIDNTTAVNPKISSKAPFWNLTLTNSGGSATQFELDEGTSGDDDPGKFETILNPTLRVLNNFTIEDDVFDHNGFNVEIGSDFVIESGADYLYNNSKKNTTTINGDDNAIMSFQNRTGGSGDEQVFWNLIIDKPHGKRVSLKSGKTGSSLAGNANNLLNIHGDAFKVLSGTLDQDNFSIRIYCDTLINYDTLTIYEPVGAGTDANINSNNDLIKFRPTPIVMLTSDSSFFGNFRLNNAAEILTLNSNLYIDRLDYKHGRIDLQDNNLKIDFLDIGLNSSQADWKNCNGCNSVEDMFITDGNASDGGLSLYFDANETLDFPIGIGTDGVDTDTDGGGSKYTPAQVIVSNYSDDGYITIRPVDKVLSTTDPTGGDIMSYYWRVDYEGFSTLPSVTYQFTYYDDDLDGSSNVASFVPGKVLEIDPFTRSSETASNFSTSSTGPPHVFGNVVFNGDTGSGSSPFALEEASYTAGQSGRFIGAPGKYYSNAWYKNWSDGSIWHQGNKTGPTGTVPPGGSIVYIYRDGGSQGRVWGNGLTNEPAKIIFEHNYTVYPDANSENVPRLQFNNPGTYPLGEVSGTGMISFDATDAITLTGDFGDFGTNEDSYYLYFGGSATISNIPSPIPSLMLEGTSPKIIDQDIEINTDLIIQGSVTVRPIQDIVINRDLVLGFWRGGTLQFPAAGVGITIDVSRNIDFTQVGNNNGSARSIVVQNSNSTLEHTLKVGKDIIHGSGNGWEFELYSASNRPKVILELQGDSTGRYYRTSTSTPELYRIVMNKGSNTNGKFTFENSFNLNGATSGSGVSKALEMQNGTLILDDSGIDIDLTTGDDDFQIPATAALQVTRGIVNVGGDDSGIRLDGSLIIDGGTVDMDDAVGNGNNYIEYGSGGNSLLEISSGSLTVGSQIRPLTSAETGVLQYRQTGGMVVIGKNDGGEDDRGMLQIYNTGSEFTYTGGSLTFVRHQGSPSVAALYLDPDEYDVSGSTITLFNGDTPAGQSDFRINSVIPLNNLAINDTNSPTVKLNINPLTINGKLTVNTNATLNAVGLTLTLNGNWTNNGTYIPNSNTTIFSSGTSQNLNGTGTFDFYDLTKKESGTLNLASSVNIAGTLFLEEGSVNDGGNSIVTSGNVIIDGTHSSSGGNGIIFSGSAKQFLSRSNSGTGTLGTVTVNNANGVEIPDGNGYNFDITGDLRLQNGVFNIGGSLVSVASSGSIVDVNAFGITNMVQTNSSFTDNGLKKYFPAGYGTDFIFPVGQLKYSPVRFDFSSGSNTFGTTAGSITVRPANEYHPTIDDGTDYFSTGDINNVLQYYWILDAGDINGFTSDIKFYYDQADVKTDEPGYTEADYIPAQILSNNNPTNSINKFTAADVDETNNVINFTLTSVTDAGISGDYFAGIDEAIPDNVATYTSTMDGNVDDPIYDIPVPGGGAPRGAVVIVATGTTVTLNINNVNFYRTEIQSGGTLTVDETDGHRIGVVSGTGTMKLVSNTSSVVVPAGFYNTFFSCTGGSLEYAGTGDYNILGGITNIRNLTLSGSGDRNFPNNDVTICEDLENNGTTSNTYTNRKIYLYGNLTLNSGVFNFLGGPTSRIYVWGDNLTINGGIFNIGSSGVLILFTGNAIVNSGTFNLGTGSSWVTLRGNFEFNGGAINSQTSTMKLNSDSYVQRIIGDFTGSNKLYNVLIDNRTGSQNYEFLGDFEVSNVLSLTDGIVNTHGNDFILGASATVSPANGKSTSFVNGRVKKVMTAGSTFTFPIGKGWRWGYAKVKNTSGGTYTWEAEYYNTGPINDPDVTSTTPTSSTINSISGNEYWRISDGGAPAGETAIIGLSWDGNSDVSANSSEREELEVMAWNGTTSTWDNFGGQNFVSGHTQSAGNFESSSTLTFTERIITLGSKDASNPLPVDLIAFKATRTEDGVQLDWETASEQNNDYFEVQKSANGIDFNAIGEVAGSGTTNEHKSYSFIDGKPYRGITYYRLKQVDFDGQFSYSKIVLIDIDDVGSSEFGFILYPNPTEHDEVFLRFETNDYHSPVEVSIVNTIGISMYSGLIDLQDLTGDLRIELKRGIKQGMYIVRITQGKRTAQGKLIILGR